MQVAEALAIQFGLQVALTSGFDKLICETDSLLNANHLSNGIRGLSINDLIAEDIVKISRAFQDVKFVFTRRNCNMAAHLQAKHVLD